MSIPFLDNAKARRIFPDRHALAEPPTGNATGDDLLAPITRLGFVQLDSVNTLERAHHMILFARRQCYRPANLARLLERDRTLFEHWTHDAAVIPTEFYPHWHLRFARDAETLRNRWKEWRRDGFERLCVPVLDQITDHGPACSADVGQGEARGSGGWWDWHPSKTALEYLWRSGALSVTRRVAFRKHYDLTDRVIPAEFRIETPETTHSIDWFCNAALDRLGFATPGEIAAFWAHVTPAEARDWAEHVLARGKITQVDVQNADGSVRRHLCRPGLADETPPEPPNRLRVLSPFDPALRDRKRAERLFGFHYRIEIFIPATKRRYGYYVFPLLEGAQMVGRIDMKANRKARILDVTNLWPEAGIRWGRGRQTRLDAELVRLARFADLDRIVWSTLEAPDSGLAGSFATG